MAPSAAQQAFATTELCEQILGSVDRKDSHYWLFIVQRVSKNFQSVVRGSNTLGIRQGLRQEVNDNPVTWDGTASPVMQALKDKLRLCPFIATSCNVPGSGAVEKTWIQGSTADWLSDTTWTFDLVTLPWHAPLGLQGRKTMYASPDASWRGIKLLGTPQPLNVLVAVRLGDTRIHETWKSTPRYEDSFQLGVEDATLGKLMDVLEEIRQRTTKEPYWLHAALNINLDSSHLVNGHSIHGLAHVYGLAPPPGKMSRESVVASRRQSGKECVQCANSKGW